MDPNTPQSHPICDYEGSDYQARFWDQGNRAYEDGAEAVAVRRLMPTGGDLLLEVGAGAGRNTPRYHGFRQIVLLDYSRTQLQQAQQRLGTSAHYKYVAANVYQLPFAPGIFDAATMIRTVHHLVDPLAAFHQIRACLRSEADFILEFANKQNLKAIARWLLRRQEWNPFEPESVEISSLNLNFHPRMIRAWLQETAFSIQRRLTVSHFRLAMLKRVVPARILVGMDALLQPTGNLWQLTPSVFVHATAIGPGKTAPQEAFWRCPICESLRIEETNDGLLCQDCRRLWPVRNGIYDFKGSATRNDL